MNPKYFKDKIYSELIASEEYIKKALDFITSYPNWSNTFKVMSDDRYNHAEQLYKMFLDFYLKSEDQKLYLNSLRDAIIEIFTSKTRLIDGYKATYDILVESDDEKEVNNE